MTERGVPIADGAPACPFVAFDDDRDERASVPDHRHRCYAETRPAPRALAHQQAYCLSSAFPVCPTFQDWARREAARARASGPGRAAGSAPDEDGAPVAGPTSAASAAAASAAAAAAGAAFSASGDHDDRGSGPDSQDRAEPSGRPAPVDDDGDARDSDSDSADSDEFGARRNPPRDWAAPPPWLASAGGQAGRTDPEGPPFLTHRSADPAQGLAGSAADWLAGGPAPVDRSAVDRDAGASAGSSASAAAAGMGAAAEAAGLSGESPAAARRQGEQDHGPGDDDRSAAEREGNPPRRPARRARAYEQHLGGTDGPDWERPRRFEAYPSIRTRVALPNMSRIAVMAGALAIAALALFFLPALLGIGGTGNPAAASAGPSASATRPSLQPTDPPAPTPFLYTIKKNETLSRIATAHGISLAELLAANPQIKNPNKITEGQQITIPTPSGGPPSQAPASASPAAS